MVKRIRLWLDRLAIRYLSSRGFVVLSETDHERARRAMEDCEDYILRSGHLNTVSGRRPRAHKVITGAVSEANGYLDPVTP